MRRLVIVKIESYVGRDTYLECGGDNGQDFMYCVVVVNDDNSAEIVDSSYRSYEEAVEAWPEAGVKQSRES
jgi:hypothetical protein